MKRLRFHDLLLLSEREHGARKVSFPNQVTVIKAENDRGKSCLIKSLYTVLGAIPKKVHPTWEALKVILLLYFSVDGTHYRMLKAGDRYSLFDESDALIANYDSVTNELGPALADLFDFRLELTNASTHEAQQATPAFLYLPFYFDQDGSWIDNWDSFSRLSQFSKYRPAIAAFHTGMRPNEYYEAKNEKTEAESRLEGLRSERAVVNRVLDKIELLMKDAQFDLDAVNYQDEVQRLLIQCNALRDYEERMRDEMVQLENKRVLVDRQIHITKSAADELEKDLVFVTEKLEEEVECPICGAEYHNSFAERFGIAADEDRLRSLLLEMTDERKSITVEIESKREIVKEVSSRSTVIREILETKMGAVKLQDILRSEGKKEVRVVLRNDLDGLNRDIGVVDGEILEAAADMKSFTNKKRTQEIREFYEQKMGLYLSFVNVTGLKPSSYKKIDCHMNETGSDGPRALLAYYYSILQTIDKYSTATFCPIVMDSPNQQEQDAENLKRMLEFIRDQRPTDSQLIVGLVSDLDIDMGGDVIELMDDYQLLQKSEYDAVAQQIRPFIDASLAKPKT